jgi:hypothetical protein
MFTARYALSPYIKQISSVFKGLMQLMQCVWARVSLRYIAMQHSCHKLVKPVVTNHSSSIRHSVVPESRKASFATLFNEANSFVYKNITWIQHTNFSFNKQDSTVRPDFKGIETTTNKVCIVSDKHSFISEEA